MEVAATAHALLHDEYPNDDALLDELLTLVERACPQTAAAWPAPPPAGGAARLTLWKILSACVFYAVLLSLVGGALLLSQGDKKPILGFTFMNVLARSMQSEIPQGSLVVLKETQAAAIRISDDITFLRDAETPATHRVVGIIEDFEGSGERGFETQGVDNDAMDDEIVRGENIVGKVIFHVPRTGALLEWLRENMIITLGFTAGLILLYHLLWGAFGKKPPKGQKQ